MKDAISVLGRDFVLKSGESHDGMFSVATYQYWLDKYYSFINLTGFKGDPLDLTIDRAKKIHKKRPLWAQTFAEKEFGFSNRKLPPDTMTKFIVDGNKDVHNWLIERELILDQRVRKTLIERSVDAGGYLRKLTVVRMSEKDGEFLYRSEDRTDHKKFGNHFTATLHNTNLDSLFKSKVLISNKLPELKNWPTKLL